MGNRNILPKIIKSIGEAEEFIYVSVPWWWDDTVGNNICTALNDAHKRGVKIKVELRPTFQNNRIRKKLISFETEITENVNLHWKIVCSEKEYLLTTANFHNKDIFINDNEIEQFKDKNKINSFVKDFDHRQQTKIRTFDGPTNETKASDLINDLDILNLIKSSIGDKKLNPLQSLSSRHAFYGNENLLVIAPTGSGKSLIGQLCIFRSILKNNSKAVWIVPHSLARQTSKNFNSLNNESLSPRFSWC